MPETHRSYFNRLAPEWHLKMSEDPLLKRHLLAFGVRQGDRILDVGCGSGRLARPLAQLVGPEGVVVAEDIAERMLHQGRSLTRERVFWICDDIHSLAMRSDLFSKVVCFSAFPHFRDNRTALWEMHRVLRPGGEILIFHLDSSCSLNAFHASLEEPVCHDILPDSASMKRLFADAGFDTVKILDTESFYWAQGRKPDTTTSPHC